MLTLDIRSMFVSVFINAVAGDMSLSKLCSQIYRYIIFILFIFVLECTDILEIFLVHMPCGAV